MTEKENRLEEIEKQIQEKYSEISELKKERQEIFCKRIKEKYLGKYISYKTVPSDDIINYLQVTDIWWSNKNKYGDSIPTITFEGYGFSWYFNEYREDTYFSWSQLEQPEFHIDYFERELEKTIEIIDEEKYVSKFNEGLEKLKQEKQ